MDFGVRRQPGRFKRGDLGQQDLAVLGIFVAQVEIDRFRLDRPGGDQHALKHLVRFGVQIVAVLERAGLALVRIDRHQARTRLSAHKAPLLPGREPGAAQATQPGIAQDLDDLIRRALPVEAVAEQSVAALFAVGSQIPVGRNLGMGMAAADGCLDGLDGGIDDMVVADFGDRRRLAAAHAGCADDAHRGRVRTGIQRFDQVVRTRNHAADAVAHADGERRRRRLLLLHHVEMGIEGRDLVDLGLGQLHLLGERREMGRREVAVGILDEVQILDQQVAPARRIAEQCPNPVERGRIDLAALGRRACLAPPCLGGLAGDICHRRNLGFQPVRSIPFLSDGEVTNRSDASGRGAKAAARRDQTAALPRIPF